jgi:hypothetical protein
MIFGLATVSGAVMSSAFAPIYAGSLLMEELSKSCTTQVIIIVFRRRSARRVPVLVRSTHDRRRFAE